MTTLLSHPRARLALLAIVLVAPLSTLDAQYFGRNKVRYDPFDFRAIATAHFDVYYYPAESIATRDAARMAERWYARHSALLDFETGRSPLIFYADHPDFQQTNVIGGFIGEGTGGVTEGSRERVIMPLTGVYAETDHVLGHELVHVFQYRVAKATRNGLRSLEGIPLWLIEGMAEYLSLGREDPNTAMWLRDAARRNDLPTLKQLTTSSRYFPYRYGHAFWAFVGAKYGDDAVPRVFRAALAGGWDKGVTAALGVKPDSLSTLWHAAIRERYGPSFAGRSAPDSIGRTVIRVSESGDQNIAPTVSPDGRYVAFFSSRDLFGIDIYLAEAATGRVLRKLTEVTSSAHFDALSFINSAGSFSPDGERLAVVTFSGGDNEITIFRSSDGDVVRRLKVRGVTAMADPAWSPDGTRIAFSGSRGGISDLYVYDLGTEGGEARQLTNGREAEIQPAWSPDGRTIAFATDRGDATDFGALRFGEMRLATIPADGTTGDVPQVLLRPTFPRGKSINPQYAPDGRAIYFVSDQDGVSDIYRVDDGGAVQRVTHVATGVSGISSLSPAITVARSTGALLFSVFHRSGFSIRSLDAPTTTVVADAGVPVAGVTPLPDAGLVARALADERTGLAAPADLKPVRPDRRLRLDYIGGPSVGVTFGGGSGGGLGGGVGLGFGDMLGDHELGLVVQAQGDIKDIGGSVQYLNLKRRWNWGALASHIPYSGAYATAEDVTFDDGSGGTVDGFVVVQRLQRVYFDNAELFAQYPLSRSRRFEISGGAQRIGSSVEIDSQFVIGNSLVDRSRTTQSGGPALNLGRGSIAFVGDNSFSAFTSPIAGTRYRLELGANAGTLNYQDALVDYRRYFFARPVTLALRGVHFGRYGTDAENGLLQDLFVGQSQAIRGYEAHTFSLDECSVPVAGGDECPEFSRLNGSRIAFVNLELRIPLIGNDRFGLIDFPFLPTELSPFVDAGVAWRASESPTWRFDRSTAERVPVVSVGVATRINLLGYAVVEIFYVRPLHRPGKSGFFGFQFAPGW